jgi:hypothetical protein
MGINDHFAGGVTERLAVKVVTVDPPTGRVEVVGKDAAVIQVSVGPAFNLTFQWPRPNENWTIVRENGYWKLESRFPTPDDALRATDLNPGETFVARKYAKVVGNGVTTAFSIRHGLNTPGIAISCWTTGAFPHSQIAFTATTTDLDTALVTISPAPATNGALVVVMG